MTLLTNGRSSRRPLPPTSFANRCKTVFTQLRHRHRHPCQYLCRLRWICRWAKKSAPDTFGRLLFRLADLPEARERLMTCSPDVSFSTNLSGWINKRGAFKSKPKPEYEGDAQQLLKWQRGPSGQHIELGISEMNLFLLLGIFGLSAELNGQMVAPIGTVYDPFVCRGLDALIYALYPVANLSLPAPPPV
ncbi:MAG: hypothetical protein R3E79_26675 [Caldilineaceae bacterium]